MVSIYLVKVFKRGTSRISSGSTSSRVSSGSRINLHLCRIMLTPTSSHLAITRIRITSSVHLTRQTQTLGNLHQRIVAKIRQIYLIEIANKITKATRARSKQTTGIKSTPLA